MSKKKILIVSIVSIITLVLVIFGVTYAFILGITNTGNVNTGSGKLDIYYDVPDNISGNIAFSNDRSGGIFTTAVAKLNTGSEEALFNMYITPTALTNLDIPAFKWEAEGVRKGQVVCSGNGDFSGKEVNKKIPVIESCELSTDNTTFTIYIWLDVKLVASSVGGASFGAKISADSVPITGGF